MTGQNPITQFENYPRTSPEPASGSVPEAPAPPRSPRLLSPTPDGVDTQKMGWNPSSRNVSRRSVLGWMVALPVAAFIGIQFFGGSSEPTFGEEDDPFYSTVFAAAPEDWDLSQGTQGMAIQHGSNEVQLMVLEDQSGEDATIMSEALAALQPSLKSDPTKAVARTVAGSPAIEVRATGTVRGKKARQVVDVFVDPDTGRALAIAQLLTASPSSTLADEAKTFVTDVVEAWPW